MGLPQAQTDPAAATSRSRWRGLFLWVVAVLLTYLAGKLAVDLVKWLVLTYLAPTAEARLILVPYVLGAVLPVLLFAMPAGWLWRRLFRTRDRAEVALLLAFELAFLVYVGAGDLQRALASFV